MVLVVIVEEGHDSKGEVEEDGIDDNGGMEAFKGGGEEVGLEGDDAGSEVWGRVLAWDWTRAGVGTRDV